MKPTIIPDYQRYTEFTPAMRIVLAELADKRFLHVVKFKVAKAQYEDVLKGDGSIIQADRLYKKMQDYLEIIGEIDQAIHEIYFLHGRLN
mgnify:CR=1 FL=1